MIRQLLRMLVEGGGGKLFNKLNTRKYMKAKIFYLKKCGVTINGQPNYIFPNVYFDPNKYSNISLGNHVTISRDVIFLTHDFSISRGFESINHRGKGTPYFLGKISVADNCFIGARCVLLPNTFVGNNCIVGAGAVLKGYYPDNSIIVGNPAKIIANTQDWARKHLAAQDYIESFR